MYPLAIEATGKAYIAYFNVNLQPPEPLLSKENAQEIGKILGESEKMWHYIKASNILDLINKLKKIIEIMLK